MQSILEYTRHVATTDPQAAARAFNKSELYAVIDGMARESQKQGETIEKARVRVGETPEGRTILMAHGLAPRAASPRDAELDSPEIIRKGVPGGDVVARIDTIAAKISREEGLSEAKSRAAAWSRNPDLKTEYDAAKSGRRTGGGRI